MIEMSVSMSRGPLRKMVLASWPGVDDGWMAPPAPNRGVGRTETGADEFPMK